MATTREKPVQQQRPSIAKTKYDYLEKIKQMSHVGYNNCSLYIFGELKSIHMYKSKFYILKIYIRV